MGPVTGAERRLIAISLALLAFWVTEGILHPLDTATTTCVAVALMLLPRIGVFAWNDAEKLVPWGTLLLFAVGISIGTVLISTGAAKWVAEMTLSRMGVASMSVLGMVMVQQFVVSFGFLLPVNSPQNMVAYGTGAFTTRDFLRTGVWITVVGYLLLLLMSATYWRWTGLLTP